MEPRDIVSKFDDHLGKKRLYFSAIATGGAALSILGIILRQTQDGDIMDPKIPKEIMDAAIEFSEMIRKNGGDLKPNWLNNGPEELARILPEGWRHRLTKLFVGKNFMLFTLSRE